MRWIRALAALAIATAALAAPDRPADTLSARQRGEDFDVLWRAVEADYAYFDSASHAAWRNARGLWRARAEHAATREAFVAALEGALETLRDDHLDLSERSASAPRRVPYDIDVWARWQAGAATIEAVRTFGDADVAGLHAGQVVTRVDDVPVAQAVRARLRGAIADARGLEWALRQALAGPERGIYRMEVREGRARASLAIEHGGGARSSGAAVLARRMGEARDVGYIRVRLGADDEHVAAHFDGALGNVLDTRALILDLRETPGPGARAATRAILAHFVAGEAPWQVRKPRRGAAVTDRIAANGAAYRAPVVVLVDRWTAGEAEALAAGLHAVAGARLIGTATAGLRGELHAVRLPNSGIVARFPAEKTLLLDGQPRESLRPAIAVDLAAPKGGPGDPILYQGLVVARGPDSEKSATLPTAPASSAPARRSAPR